MNSKRGSTAAEAVLKRSYGTIEQAAEKVKKQIPRRLKPVRDDKK
jgi:hypothetical protein